MHCLLNPSENRQSLDHRPCLHLDADSELSIMIYSGYWSLGHSRHKEET